LQLAVFTLFVLALIFDRSWFLDMVKLIVMPWLFFQSSNTGAQFLPTAGLLLIELFDSVLYLFGSLFFSLVAVMFLILIHLSNLSQFRLPLFPFWVVEAALFFNPISNILSVHLLLLFLLLLKILYKLMVFDLVYGSFCLFVVFLILDAKCWESTLHEV